MSLEALKRAESRFVPEPNTGCWIWSAAVDNRGYGRISVHNKWRHAHRFLYEQYVGSVPEGLELDHICRTPCCVNPEHLEPVTHQENMRRAGASGAMGIRNKRKSHCPNGHEYAGSNLYVTSNGWRQCHECRKNYMLENYRKRKNATT
jgi:hypothetical protein